jgi:hypothetical protein
VHADGRQASDFGNITIEHYSVVQLAVPFSNVVFRADSLMSYALVASCSRLAAGSLNELYLIL